MSTTVLMCFHHFDLHVLMKSSLLYPIKKGLANQSAPTGIQVLADIFFGAMHTFFPHFIYVVIRSIGIYCLQNGWQSFSSCIGATELHSDLKAEFY